MQQIAIHNGGAVRAAFSVYYRIPDYVEDGFTVAPGSARDWIRIEGESPVLAPRETRMIEVILDLPDQAQAPERWEFWIGVREKTENALTTELCSRWLITMRGN